MNVVVCSLADIFIFTAGLSENGIASTRRESHLGAAHVGRIVGASYSHCSGYTFTFILAVLTCERMALFIFLIYNCLPSWIHGTDVDILWVF